MASCKPASSKDRTTNFSKDEITKLTCLLQDYPLITCKKTDHSSNQQKEMAWRSLAEKFNSDATVHRNIKQLQQKFNNMKKIARKEKSAERNGRRQTGGGPPPPAPSETTEWLNSIMSESISGLPAVFDSDATGNETIDVYESVAAVSDVIILDPAMDIISNVDNNPKFSVSQDETKQDKLQDMDFTHISEKEEEKNVFDTSTPRAMLRKPISKQLLTSNRKRKHFTPQETRKKIVSHIDSKLDLIHKKKAREEMILKYAAEEQTQIIAERREIHQASLNMMEEKHLAFLAQQKELHALEVEFKKKYNDLVLEKTRLELEKTRLELDKTRLEGEKI